MFSLMQPDVHLSLVDSLQYVFFRNYEEGVVQRVLNLMHFPTS